MSLFEGVVQRNDEIEDGEKRAENLIRGILAGNIFDLGSAQLAEVFAKDGMSFLASCQNLLSRPWVIDDLDAFKSKWTKKSWDKFWTIHASITGEIITGQLDINYVYSVAFSSSCVYVYNVDTSGAVGSYFC
ncbi:hypothetical protein ACQJBY_063959 [Aegilops geniculata]